MRSVLINTGAVLNQMYNVDNTTLVDYKLDRPRTVFS
jgi:hypothetical protein